MKTFPDEFLNRMRSLLSDDYDDFINALNSEPVKGFRINTDKISLEDYNKINIFGNEKIPYTENGYYLDYEKAGNHPFHHAGMIYIQEPAAMAPAECIDIVPSWHILDLCAAPGGKSTQLKNKLGKNGVLVSNEIILSRCRILTGNIERLGLQNTITTCLDTGKLSSVFSEKFDLIMCDAPCSGEGMFRKDDTAIEEWSLDNVKICAQRQKEILENAVGLLKTGGYIIYATCTFSLEENEMVIDSFLKSNPDFEIMRVKSTVEECTCDGIRFDGCVAENIEFCRRFYPHKAKGEGQFMAVLHNTSAHINNLTAANKKKLNIDKSVIEFLDDTLTQYDYADIKMHNQTPVLFSSDINFLSNNLFSLGINIGEIKKNYIQPHHQFFMAMGKYFKRRIELSPESNELKKYLHGEEIETDVENGWAVITVCGVSVGGVKIVNGKAKNHYPKGLRTKY